MKLKAQVLGSILLLLIAAWVIAKLHYPGKAQMKLPTGDCNADLWNRVYEKDRLKVIEECSAVDGRVLSVQRSKDGDLHIALDPDVKSVLNLINVIHSHRTLIVEAVCDHTPELRAAKQACTGFHSEIEARVVGDTVRVTGAYVTDRDNGWNEIHPVSRIDLFK